MNELPKMTINGERLSALKHDMALTEAKSFLQYYKDFAALDTLEQLIMCEMMEQFVLTYLYIMQDNLLKEFETDLIQ